MRIFPAIVVAALILSAAAGQESRTALPQPRMRLDPARSAAIAEPKKAERTESSDSAVIMSPFIVRSTPVRSDDREQARVPTGPISVLSGGWIYRTDKGALHVEVGVWPYQNILWKNDTFKPEMMHVGAEFVRISW